MHHRATVALKKESPGCPNLSADGKKDYTSYTFKPDVIIHSGNLTVEIANTASEELLKKLWRIVHVYTCLLHLYIILNKINYKTCYSDQNAQNTYP